MNNKYLIVILLIGLNIQLAYGDISLKEVYYNYNNKNIISLVTKNKESYLYKTSLKSCTDIEHIPLGKIVSIAEISKYVPSYLLTGSKNGLGLFNLLNKSQSWIGKPFVKKISYISQSNTGEYIAVTDGVLLRLYQFGKTVPRELFNKEFKGDIVSTIPDTEKNKLFIAEKSGIITSWDFSGKLLNTINTEKKIISLKIDERNNTLILVLTDGVYKVDKDSLLMKPIHQGKISNIFIDNKNSLLIYDNVSIPTKYTFNIYNIMTNNLLFKIGGVDQFSKIGKTYGANFISIINGTSIKLYDLKLGKHLITISITEKGSIFYLPEQYDNIINSTFIDMAAGNKIYSKPIQDPKQSCSIVNAMISGVYSPDITNTNSPFIDKDIELLGQGIYKPIVIKPLVNQNINIAKTPKTTINEIEFKSEVIKPKVKNNIIIEQPKKSIVPKVEKPTLKNNMKKGSVPSWFANRRNLPIYNSVQTGLNEESARNNAIKDIKNTIVKNILSQIVNNENVKNISNIEVKKRFLWNVASSSAVALEKNIKAVNFWISPAGQFYIHMNINKDIIQPKANEIFQIEYEKLKTLTEEEYMSKPINKLD